MYKLRKSDCLADEEKYVWTVGKGCFEKVKEAKTNQPGNVEYGNVDIIKPTGLFPTEVEYGNVDIIKPRKPTSFERKYSGQKLSKLTTDQPELSIVKTLKPPTRRPLSRKIAESKQKAMKCREQNLRYDRFLDRCINFNNK